MYEAEVKGEKPGIVFPIDIEVDLELKLILKWLKSYKIQNKRVEKQEPNSKYTFYEVGQLISYCFAGQKGSEVFL